MENSRYGYAVTYKRFDAPKSKMGNLWLDLDYEINCHDTFGKAIKFVAKELNCDMTDVVITFIQRMR